MTNTRHVARNYCVRGILYTARNEFHGSKLSRDDNPFKRSHIRERDGTFLFLVTRCSQPYMRRSHKSRRARGSLARSQLMPRRTTRRLIQSSYESERECPLSRSTGVGRRLESHGTTRGGTARSTAEKRFAGDTEICRLRARSRTIRRFSPYVLDDTYLIPPRRIF